MNQGFSACRCAPLARAITVSAVICTVLGGTASQKAWGDGALSAARKSRTQQPLDGPNRVNETDQAASELVNSLFAPFAPEDPVPSAAVRMFGAEPTKANRRPQWTARLVRNPNPRDGNPPFALIDRYGGVQRYIEPVAGIDLDSHIGATVSVKRDTGGTLLASQLDLPRTAVRAGDRAAATQTAAKRPQPVGVQLAAAEEAMPQPDLAEGAPPATDPIPHPEAIEGEVIDEGPVFNHQGEMDFEGVDPLYLGGHEIDGCTVCGDAVCGGRGCLNGCGYGSRPVAYVRGEYLLWWFDGMDTPPLVVSSPDEFFDADDVLDPDDIVDPVIYGGDDSILDGSRDGGRVIAGVWLDDCGKWAIEGDYFGFGRISSRFVAGDPNSPSPPYIFRPFFDVNPIDPDGGGPLPPTTGPTGQEVDTDNLQGTVTVDADSEFNSAGLRLRHGICCVPGCVTGCGDCVTCGSGVGGGGLLPSCPIIGGFFRGATRRVDMAYGIRWSQLDERLSITEDLLVITNRGTSTAGSRILLNDSFSTSNEFVGGELGFLVDWQNKRWSLELLSRLAIGGTKQQVRITGNTRTTPAGGIAVDNPNFGLLAQPTNVGVYERDEFSVIPELGVTGGYMLTKQLKLTLGYTLLYWTRVVRPGDQIDFDVNSDFLNIPADPTTVDPQRPLFAFQSTDIWAHGLNLGLEYQW